MTELIQPIQQRIHEFTHALASTSFEHPSCDRVQELEQQADETWWEIERITPILAQFHQKVGSTKQLAEKDITKVVSAEEQREETREEEQNKDKGGQEDEVGQEESHQEGPNHAQDKPVDT